MYDFAENATEETVGFVGYNKGTPINFPESAGMLKTGDGIIQAKCFYPSRNISAAVPYFNTTVQCRIIFSLKEYPSTNICLTP